MKRFKAKVVKVGNVEIGGNNPIRIQSMTNTDTLDVIKTTEQIMRLQDCGCDIARVTVQGMSQAKACEQIKNNLIKARYSIPIVADIHFFPKAAIFVADFVDKVRINPGNFVRQLVNDDNILLKIEEDFFPLIEKCKNQNKAIRIGANHGSLSERILFQYGNTIEGMVVSAIEYGEICRKHDFNDIIFSMKASNPIVMIGAYRDLVARMIEKKWDYPLHLGVTEAGSGEDGIVKSSVGIGSLLLDGIGDTIRISLTDEPEREILPAKKLVDLYTNYTYGDEGKLTEKYSVYNTNCKRKIRKLKNLHRHTLAIMEGDSSDLLHKKPFVDALLIVNSVDKGIYPSSDNLNFNREEKIDLRQPNVMCLNDIDFENLDKLKNIDPGLIFFSPESNRIDKTRELNNYLIDNHKTGLLIAHFLYKKEGDGINVAASSEMGSLLFDDIIDGICIKADIPYKDRYNLTFSILQACRKRITKTEYISCPGCGRTLYDIQNVTQNIKKKTSHLIGVKIAIMGCIVNGPGEMADADFGFIGSGKGKVDLYVGKKCVEKNIDFSLAEDQLINLIKREGRWVDEGSLLT